MNGKGEGNNHQRSLDLRLRDPILLSGRKINVDAAKRVEKEHEFQSDVPLVKND